MSGTLYIIGTPIGNLEDITLRQLRMLEEVDFVAAEDTRMTSKILAHYDIKKSGGNIVSFHEHSLPADSERIIRRLLEGESCGLVTDAGMPCISDPGEVLVRKAYANDIPVKAVPGPTAVTTAAALSGMNVRRFTFEAFLPVANKERLERFELLRNETAVMIFYEAPHKLKKTLSAMAEFFGGDRKITICREITKIYEETLHFTLDEAVAYYNENEPRGEFVLLLEGRDPSADGEMTIEQAMEQVKKLIDMGEKPTDACKAVAKETGFKKGELYSALQQE
ncbi:16S rRNA (cytidine(1402)-2'-O)-methyltransferase [Ruminococcus sp. XPD3002]|uniref:16S rRNA (cytidine(1402)-2'-O)-methyltransferase n=1 Tax=Ruminococcus sp. XPD3002 TaxID=1452269 RepID=UPI000922EB9D|nr:16S rRNA (cytidine1402-2'-O)-methyltransferase [Ruminococcus flavefaciens]HPY84254.1 16S rRNA (cytidine(1402)-2'-O)-methyltransferase [Ruminococcus flavefaciens]HRU97590.1 16S rRNA (cytidine(1402)-2'-O)-methyltransferase [Ruminococcus sp.]